MNDHERALWVDVFKLVVAVAMEGRLEEGACGRLASDAVRALRQEEATLATEAEEAMSDTTLAEWNRARAAAGLPPMKRTSVPEGWVGGER